MYWLPCLVMAPSVCLPPVEFCLGVRPSQAAKSRPDLNALGSLQIVDRSVEPPESLDQNLYGHPGGVWKSRITFGQLKQFVDTANSFGGDNAELRKMAAQRVDANRPLFDEAVRAPCAASVWLAAPRS